MERSARQWSASSSQCGFTIEVIAALLHQRRADPRSDCPKWRSLSSDRSAGMRQAAGRGSHSWRLRSRSGNASTSNDPTDLFLVRAIGPLGVEGGGGSQRRKQLPVAA